VCEELDAAGLHEVPDDAIDIDIAIGEEELLGKGIGSRALSILRDRRRDHVAYITLTPDSIQSEHICCAFSDEKCAEGYALKKRWLAREFENGYIFRRLDERAKVFLEYGPAPTDCSFDRLRLAVCSSENRLNHRRTLAPGRTSSSRIASTIGNG